MITSDFLPSFFAKSYRPRVYAIFVPSGDRADSPKRCSCHNRSGVIRFLVMDFWGEGKLKRGPAVGGIGAVRTLWQCAKGVVRGVVRGSNTNTKINRSFGGKKEVPRR